MLFVSFRFILIFLPAVLCVSRLLRGSRLLAWIFLSSLAFYAMEGQPWFLLPMLFTMTLDYFLALVLERTSSPASRRLILLLSLCGNLGLLTFFKYAKLLSRTLAFLWNPGGHGLFSTVLLPAGISFYTFQTLSYMIDVYRRKARAERNFWKFACFVSFFPHLVAGPLTRHDQLMPALGEIERDGISPRWQAGVFLFVIGLGKKILLADPLGEHVDRILADSHLLGPMAAWLAVFGYSLQIYFDFSGYSDMAIGLGRLFGIELPPNFDSPYQALNPSDFWRRWHMTLSSWFRDYMYIPLGGSRKGSAWRAFSLLVTMFLGGLWHGAEWTFAAWGLYHGLLLVLYHVTRPAWDRLAVPCQRAATFLLVTLGWVLFRSSSFGVALDWLFALGGRRGEAVSEIDSTPAALLAYIIAGTFLVQTFSNVGGRERLDRLSVGWQIALGTVAVAAVLFLGFPSRFLYYQF